MDIIEKYVDNNNYINYDELYKKLIDLFYDEIPNSLYIINFIMYDKFKFYPFNSSNQDVLSLALERRGQSDFRINIINRDKKCIISGDNISMCEACHIIPYNKSKSYDINNGILLTASLHKLFDKYYFSINNNKVMLSNKILNKKTFDDYQRYHEQIINVPKECIENLKSHYNKFLELNY